MVQSPFSPSVTPTPMQNSQSKSSSATNGARAVHPTTTFVKSKVQQQQPPTTRTNSGVTNMITTTTTSTTSTQLPTPLARSMASTATAGPRPPPPPASLAQTPPFLTKLYNLVEDSGTTELVSWTDDASAFTVHKPDEFGRDVLPRYFKHNNFSSFVRQLNQYGFHKRDPDRWTFGHVNFRRGRLDLLRLISRRRPKAASTSSTASTPVELTVQPPQAVIELGNFGLAGKLQALQRDKEVLVKELVITRKAEQALQEKCEGLENRLGMLEESTKQMQNFILHYFSKVLQPYSDEIASRKRKRLPPAAPSSFDLISPSTNIGSGSAASAAMTTAGLPPPTGSSLEALRHMMQKMQMSQPNVSPNSPGGVRRPPPVEMEPAIVHELMHDDVMSTSSADVTMGTTARQANGQSSTSATPSKSYSSPPVKPSPLPQISSPEASTWLEPRLLEPIKEVSMKEITEGESTPRTRSVANKNPQRVQQTKEDMALEDVIVSESEFEPIGNISPLWANAHETPKDENEKIVVLEKETEKEPIDEFMNLEDDVNLLPPLTPLQIQEFGGDTTNNSRP